MTVRPFVVPEPKAVRKQGTDLLTSAGIWRCIQEEIYGQRYGFPGQHAGFFHGAIPWTELIAEDDLPGGKPGRDKRARYELRYRKFALSEAGLLTAEHPLTEKHFRYHQIGVPIHDMRRMDLMREQPGLDWWVVAFVVEKKRVDMPSETLRTALDSRTVAGVGFGEAMPSPDPTSYKNQDPQRTAPEPAFGFSSIPLITPVEDYHFVVHLAWADISGGDLVDTVTEHHTADRARESVMSEYADTRNLRNLTPGGRKNRNEAIAVIRTYNETQRALTGEPEPRSARALPAPAPSPGPDRADAMRARVVEMRTAGTPVASIVRSTKLTLTEVRGILADHAQQKEREDGSSS